MLRRSVTWHTHTIGTHNTKLESNIEEHDASSVSDLPVHALNDGPAPGGQKKTRGEGRDPFAVLDELCLVDLPEAGGRDRLRRDFREHLHAQENSGNGYLIRDI